MKLYLLIYVWRGTIGEIKAFSDKEKASSALTTDLEFINLEEDDIAIYEVDLDTLEVMLYDCPTLRYLEGK